MPPVAYRLTVSFLGHTSSEITHADNLGTLLNVAKRCGADTPDWTRITYSPLNDGTTHWIISRAAFTGTKQGEPIDALFTAIS